MTSAVPDESDTIYLLKRRTPKEGSISPSGIFSEIQSVVVVEEIAERLGLNLRI